MCRWILWWSQCFLMIRHQIRASKNEIMDTEENKVILMVAELIASTEAKRKHPRRQLGHAAFHRNRYASHERLMLD